MVSQDTGPTKSRRGLLQSRGAHAHAHAHAHQGLIDVLQSSRQDRIGLPRPVTVSGGCILCRIRADCCTIEVFAKGLVSGFGRFGRTGAGISTRTQTSTTSLFYKKKGYISPIPTTDRTHANVHLIEETKKYFCDDVPHR